MFNAIAKPNGCCGTPTHSFAPPKNPTTFPSILTHLIQNWSETRQLFIQAAKPMIILLILLRIFKGSYVYVSVFFLNI